MFSRASFAAAISGALSDGVSATILFPLDVLKIRAQIDSKTSAMQILQNEGLISLWKGVEDKWIVSPQQKLQYFYVETALLNLFASVYKRKPGIMERLAIGYFSALQGTLTTIPLDVTFTRRRIQPPGENKSFVRMFMDTVNNEGFASFYRGWSVNALLCLNPAITFVCFERLRVMWLHYRHRANLNHYEAFIVGALSKAVATVLTMPLMRAKAIANTWQNKDVPVPPNLTTILLQLLEKEGVAGWFAGIYPQLTKGVLNSALMLMLKDSLDQVVRRVILHQVDEIV